MFRACSTTLGPGIDSLCVSDGKGCSCVFSCDSARNTGVSALVENGRKDFVIETAEDFTCS